ncbi:MAG TPA: hypothetical protein VIF81_01230 [Pyrinomonadaceae bacterium]
MKKSKAKEFGLRVSLVTALFALLTIGAASFRQPNVQASSECSADCQQQLVLAMMATAQYHNESKARADGFISTFDCVEAPGLGAMGIHYINPFRMMDINVDVTQPEALLYLPQNDGTNRLVGMEYVVPVLSNGAPWFGGPTNPPPAIDNLAPVLFGQTFDGPMPGHTPGQPWHYDLHVWAWQNNPSGLFFPFNPKLRCQQ